MTCVIQMSPRKHDRAKDALHELFEELSDCKQEKRDIILHLMTMGLS